MVTYKDKNGKVYTEEEAIAVIPKHTIYCYHNCKMVDEPYEIEYEGKKVTIPHKRVCDYCLFWELKKDKEEQENGYCHFLKRGDWESEGMSLLWDAVKECGINEEGFGDEEDLESEEDN